MYPLTLVYRWVRLRHRWIALGVAGLIGAMPLQALASGGLPATVEAALQRAQVPRDALSVVVVPAARGKGAPVLSHRAQVPVNPASLMKLVTTTVALDQLGPAFTWTTPV